MPDLQGCPTMDERGKSVEGPAYSPLFIKLIVQMNTSTKTHWLVIWFVYKHKYGILNLDVVLSNEGPVKILILCFGSVKMMSTNWNSNSMICELIELNICYFSLWWNENMSQCVDAMSKVLLLHVSVGKLHWLKQAGHWSQRRIMIGRLKEGGRVFKETGAINFIVS